MSSKCSSYKCKMCYDMGKPATDYNSHYVKSADRSKVTCPVILGMKCRYCGDMGHTLKYCAKLLEKEKRDMTPVVAQTTSVAKVAFKKSEQNFVPHRGFKSPHFAPHGGFKSPHFAPLFPKVDFPKVDFPKVDFQKGAVAIDNIYSILDDDEEDDEEEEVQKSYADAVNTEPAPPAPVILPIPKLVRSEPKRWADYSDSEDEDYYEI